MWSRDGCDSSGSDQSHGVMKPTEYNKIQKKIHTPAGEDDWRLRDGWKGRSGGHFMTERPFLMCWCSLISLGSQQPQEYIAHMQSRRLHRKGCKWETVILRCCWGHLRAAPHLCWVQLLIWLITADRYRILGSGHCRHCSSVCIAPKPERTLIMLFYPHLPSFPQRHRGQGRLADHFWLIPPPKFPLLLHFCAVDCVIAQLRGWS